MWRNGVVAWFSRKVRYQPDSTCNAELGALNTVLKETMFASNQLNERYGSLVATPHLVTPKGNTQYDAMGVPHLVCDGKSALDIIKNPGVTKRSAHYETWLFFARDAFLTNKARFFHTTTDKMMADNLTKVVDRTKFFACRNYQMNI